MTADEMLIEIEHDAITAFRLVADRGDPPRFYVLERGRRLQLLAIGDVQEAKQRFRQRTELWKRQRLAGLAAMPKSRRTAPVLAAAEQD